MRTASSWSWWASVLVLLVVLADPGRGHPTPEPSDVNADRPSGWPDLWGVLRAIRDTTRSDPPDQGNVTEPEPPPRPSAFDQVTKQVSDKVASMFHSVRTSLLQLTGAKQGVAGGLGETLNETVTAPDTDLETDASSDILGAEAANKQAPEDVVSTPAPTATPQSFVSSALERVRGAGRTFSEMGRAVSRWGKAMADSVVGSTVNTAVNSAVGTVLQVIKGGKHDDDADHVCFAGLGCFSLLEPWTSSKRPLPRMNAPDDVQTRFLLYTRTSEAGAEAELAELAVLNDTVANATRLLPNTRTFVVVHGFNDKAAAAWVQELKDALLEAVDANVILVDWAPGAHAARNYLQAASNTRIVGAELARLLEMLTKRGDLSVDSVHVIGHSLGAHAAGYAGKQLGGRLARITALDAAQPAFEEQAPEVRIAAGDAVFVDVIHTNGVPFIPTLGFGVMQAVGDVDFYLNGGTVQPGCFVPKLPAVHSLMDLATLPVSVLGDMLSCSHRRAIEYFTEAVRSQCRMWGQRRPEPEDAMQALQAGGGRDKARPRPETPTSTPSDSRRQAPWWSPSRALGLGGLLAGVWGGSKAAPTEAPPSKQGFFSAFFGNVFSSASSKNAAIPLDGNALGDSTHAKNDDILGTAEDKAPTSAPAASATSPASASPSTRMPAPSWCEDDCLPLGLDTDAFGLKGTFHVQTADRAPYCQSQELNEVE